MATDGDHVTRLALPVDMTGDAGYRMRGQLLDAARQAPGRLQVDCRDVEHLDAAALSILVATTHAAKAHGRRLEVVHPNSIVLGALRQSGLDRVLTVIEDPFPPRPWSDLD